MICYHNLVSGNWLEEEYDDAQMEKGFRFGDLQIVITHMGMQAHIYMERGDRNAVKVLDRVLEFADIYEYDYGRLARYSHFILLHYKFQEFEKVLELAPIGLKWIRDNLGNVPGRIMVYSLQIKALFMLGKYGELEETFREAEDLSRGEQLAPYFKSYFLTATLMFEIQKLEGLTHEGKRKTWASQFRKTKKAGRRALRTCKKVAYERVETYRLIGLSYWLVKKEHTALKWWSRALSESEKLGARIERAVTMREVSRWFREAGSNHFELQKMDADSLNQQATELFEEMEIPNNNR
jgi:tetratricopeptide (TPR) repeat protein